MAPVAVRKAARRTTKVELNHWFSTRRNSKVTSLKYRRLSIAYSLLTLGAILVSTVGATAQTHSCDKGAPIKKPAHCKKGSGSGSGSAPGSGSISVSGSVSGTSAQGSISAKGGSSSGSQPAVGQQELQHQQALLKQMQNQKQMQSLLQLLRQNPTQTTQQNSQGQQAGQSKVAKNNKKGKTGYTTPAPGSGVTVFGSSSQSQGGSVSGSASGSFGGNASGNAAGSVSGNANGSAGGNASGSISANSGGNGGGSGSISATAGGNVRGSVRGSASANNGGNSSGSIRATANGNGLSVNGSVRGGNGSAQGSLNVRVNGQLPTLQGQAPLLKAQVPKLGVNVQGQLPTIQGQAPNVSANLPTLQLPGGPQIQLPQLPFPNLQFPQLPQLGNLPFPGAQLPQGGGGVTLPTGTTGQPSVNFTPQAGGYQPQGQSQLTPQQRTQQALAAQRLARQQAMQNALQQQPNNQNLQQQLQQYLPQGGGAFGVGNNNGGGGNNAGGGNGGNNGGGNNGGGQSQGNQQSQNQNRQNNANILQNEVYKTTYMREAAAKAKALAADTALATNDQIQKTQFLAAERMAGLARQPKNSTPAAKASGQAQANQAGNSAADIAREQAVQAIDYCSRFMRNFTTEGGNKWNRFRDGVFVPMAILILLPGAVVCQVRAIISQGSPIVGQVSPIDGMQRGMIAVFLIPGSYLICNYAIDLGNSIQFTVADEYKRLFQTDMYQDAMCAEIRAFGPRYVSENDSSLNTPPWDFTPQNPQGIFAKAEARIWGKLEDPCSGLHLVPANRDDASIESSNVAVRSLLNTTNAAMCTGWSILCAFQMAFFYYLFFVGPIMAALWVWPMKFLRDAFGSWVEGVVTLCFWSLFWSTTILLLACFKGTDDTGIFMVTAINFLATASVKYAFDFGGLVKAAGQKAAELADKAGDSK